MSGILERQKHKYNNRVNFLLLRLVAPFKLMFKYIDVGLVIFVSLHLSRKFFFIRAYHIIIIIIIIIIVIHNNNIVNYIRVHCHVSVKLR